MTFIEILKQARSTPTAILHEFWTQYDPKKKRVHVFIEAFDDEVFYRTFLEKRLPPGTRAYYYRCNGKQYVYDAFSYITKQRPHIKNVFFLVDKDLDDILGESWPTDCQFSRSFPHLIFTIYPPPTADSISF